MGYVDWLIDCLIDYKIQILDIQNIFMQIRIRGLVDNMSGKKKILGLDNGVSDKKAWSP